MVTGQLVKEYRSKRGFSQRQISRELGYGSAQYISNCERGLCGLSPKKAREVCRILKIPSTQMKGALMLDAAAKIEKSF